MRRLADTIRSAAFIADQACWRTAPSAGLGFQFGNLIQKTSAAAGSVHGNLFYSV
jgi:hypothetical protein